MLRTLGVEGLFGRFSYEISLAPPPPQGRGITILTAPNGYGKSTVLRLVDDFFRGDFSNLLTCAFNSLSFGAADGQVLTVRKGGQGSREERVLSFSSRRPGDSELTWTSIFPLPDQLATKGRWNALAAYQRIAERELGFRRIGPLRWRDGDTGQTYGRDELIAVVDSLGLGVASQDVVPEWLEAFRSGLSVLYISANRLRVDLDSTRATTGEMVEVISERVLEQIRSIGRAYVDAGRRLEQSFPTRIIDALNGPQQVTEAEVADLIESVRRAEARYQKLGLLSEGQTVRVSQYPKDSAALVVLKTYLQDIEAKLQSLRDAADRLSLFVDTLNSMLLFKRIELHGDSGIFVTGDRGESIPLQALSSGEQHLIVLLGKVMFEAPERGLVLLDEPEISFHPEWQERFPAVLEKVTSLSNCMIVLATHSPTLVQDRWESVIELADQVVQQ